MLQGIESKAMLFKKTKKQKRKTKKNPNPNIKRLVWKETKIKEAKS